jgi:hypothetical protein
MKIRSMLFITLLAISGSAVADYPHILNIGVLRADCELLDRPSQVRCEAFLMGVFDTVKALTSAGKLNEKYFCAPQGITEIRLRQVFVEDGAAGYTDTSVPAVDVVLGAFSRAFPCK